MNPIPEIMYSHNSILIAGTLFILILVANEIGYRIGHRYQQRTDKDVKFQTNAIQGGTLGLLALLLGFTFNMALQRFDSRSKAVIKESNAIGTALLRTKLLPVPYDSATKELMHSYITLRITAGTLDMTELEIRSQINHQTDSLQNLIWESGVSAAIKDPRQATTGNFINALNNMIDARSERNAYLQLHVPEVILFLLFIVFIMSGALMGYSSGLGQKRAYIPTVLMTFLITLVVFIIIDLDRPKRGLIRVNQSSLMELQGK